MEISLCVGRIGIGAITILFSMFNVDFGSFLFA